MSYQLLSLAIEVLLLGIGGDIVKALYCIVAEIKSSARLLAGVTYRHASAGLCVYREQQVTHISISQSLLLFGYY